MRNRNTTTVQGIVLLCVFSLLAFGAGPTLLHNVTWQDDQNAGGHNLTNAATVSTTNLTVSGSAALSTNTTAGGARVLTTNDYANSTNYAATAAASAQANAEAVATNLSSAAQSNAVVYASTNAVALSRLPTGTTSSTVALGNAPAAAQAAAIAAAEANAATIYISLAGSTNITGDMGANGGSNWKITQAGAASFDDGSVVIGNDDGYGSAYFANDNFHIQQNGGFTSDGGQFQSDGYGDSIQAGTTQPNGGVFDQYGNPIIDSAAQVYYGGNGGIALDNQGQTWWSNWNYTPTVALDNLNQLHYGDGAILTTFNEVLYADRDTIELGDGYGDGNASFADGQFSIGPNGSFAADSGSIYSDGSGVLQVRVLFGSTNINCPDIGAQRFEFDYYNTELTDTGDGDLVVNKFGGSNGSGTITVTQLKSVATQTTVNGSASGTAVFSEPLAGSSFKLVSIHLAALNGTASYTFPTAFMNAPTENDSLGLATSISTTSVTVTGTTTTKDITLVGY